MMSQGNFHSVQPTPYASNYASRRESSVDLVEQPRLPRASEIRTVLDEAVASGEVDVTPLWPLVNGSAVRCGLSSKCDGG